MKGLTPREQIARLRAFVARGLSVNQAATRIKKPRTTLRRWAERYRAKLPRRSLSPEKERRLKRVLDRDASLRTLARIVGCGKSTVHRRRKTRLEKLGAVPSCPAWRCGKCGGAIVIVTCKVCGTERPTDGSRDIRRRAG